MVRVRVPDADKEEARERDSALSERFPPVVVIAVRMSIPWVSFAEDLTPVREIFPEDTMGDIDVQKKIPLPVTLLPLVALEAEASPVMLRLPAPGANV